MSIKLLYLFYFLSGLTALVYEVVWARKLGLIFGVDAWGTATVLATFFTGLAIGSYLLGKVVDSSKFKVESSKLNPLILYGFLEIGIGIYAAMTPLIFNNLPTFSNSLTTLATSFAVLILPTIMMGGTWPAAVKAVAQMNANLKQDSADGLAGWLYGFNTFGATIGVFLAGFLLIWMLGMNMTVFAAAATNLVIGVGAIYLSSKFKVQSSKLKLKVKNEAHKLSLSNQQLAILAVFFLTGFAALALEVLWTRVLILAFGTSTYAFSLILGAFLLGIALGSFLASRFFKKQAKISFNLAASLLILGIMVVVSSFFLGETPRFIAGILDPENFSFSKVIAASVLISGAIIILPAILMGLNFVFGLRLLREGEGTAGDISRAYAVNTFGGVAGALIGGFLLLPNLGLQKSILSVSLTYFLASILVCFWLYNGKKLRWTVMAVSLAAILSGLISPSWNKHEITSGAAIYLRDYLSGGLSFKEAVGRGEILFYKEGLLSTIVVKRAPEGYLFLRGDGKADASTDQDLDDMHLIGHLPMILHQNPQKVLVIGMGSGITAGSVAGHGGTGEIEIVEIERAMVGAASYFAEYNHNVLGDSRVKVVNADVRGYLNRVSGGYDVITSQPSNLWVRGNANLFTSDFFEIAKESLSDDGLMLQWVPYYGMTNEQFKTILASFNASFAHVSVWTPAVSHDVLLVGSKKAQKFDFEEIDRKVKEEKVQADLGSAAIVDGKSFLAHYLFDELKLKEFVSGSKIHTDDKPILEFSAPFSLYKDTIVENLNDIEKLQSFDAQHFSNLDNESLNQVLEKQKSIKLIFEAKIKATQGELDKAAADFEEALGVLPKMQTKKELARVYFELARRSFELNDLTKTVFYFEEGVKNSPNAEIYLNLSILYLQQNRIIKAKGVLDEAKKLEPNNQRIAEVEKAINSATQR